MSENETDYNGVLTHRANNDQREIEPCASYPYASCFACGRKVNLAVKLKLVREPALEAKMDC